MAEVTGARRWLPRRRTDGGWGAAGPRAQGPSPCELRFLTPGPWYSGEWRTPAASAGACTGPRSQELGLCSSGSGAERPAVLRPRPAPAGCGRGSVRGGEASADAHRPLAARGCSRAQARVAVRALPGRGWGSREALALPDPGRPRGPRRELGRRRFSMLPACPSPGTPADVA